MQTTFNLLDEAISLLKGHDCVVEADLLEQCKEVIPNVPCSPFKPVNADYEATVRAKPHLYGDAAPLAEQRGDELDELRAEQARLVMPHIGPLLDAWEVLPNDVSQDDDLSGVRHHIEQIFQCMDSNGNPSTPAVQLRADEDDEAIRAIWRANGGDFHGPHIETGKMPESKLLPFLRRLIAEIPSAAPASPAAAKEE